MKTIPIARRGISRSRLVLGCMGFGGNDAAMLPAATASAMSAFDTAREIGITMFDHADIYRDGRAESVFGEWLKANPGLRQEITIQSKCGIRRGGYDCSAAHILDAVDGSLRRLGTEYLDILLLHRPDALLEPAEVAEAFTRLRAAGKVRFFGVSNMSVPQIQFLQHALPASLVVNQLEMSLARPDWALEGMHVNHSAGSGVHFSPGLIEYCQMQGIQLQAWGPLGQGLFSGRLLEGAPEHTRKAAEAVRAMAEEKGTTAESVVLGWLMRHPAGIQPVLGTTRPERIVACRDAERIAAEFTRAEWYALLELARGAPLP